MKEFWERYSYVSVKMFVDQLVISIFGLVLAIACGLAENTTLQLVCSVGAILFYLFLIYALMWETGTKDKPGVDAGRRTGWHMNGFYMSLLANSLNILLAVIITVCMFAADGSIISQIGALSATVSMLIEGMYCGLLAVDVAGAPMNSYFWAYFMILIPALATSAAAYIFGVKGWHLTKILIADTPEDEEVKREKKREKEGRSDE